MTPLNKTCHNLFVQIYHILTTNDACAKATKTLQTFEDFYNTILVLDFTGECPVAPDHPARPQKPELLPPHLMPHRSKGYKKKAVLMHALAHIELNAIDLACDMILRFKDHALPLDFYTDWLKVAYDEARHFLMLNDYLISINSFYGAYPAHNSLWETAFHTRHNLAARLAVVPMVLEARGLDITPRMILEFETIKDYVIADMLRTIYTDEITHVAIGVKWFEHVCGYPIEQATHIFHTYLDKHYRGNLIPPFNKEARNLTRMPEDFYETYEKIKI